MLSEQVFFAGGEVTEVPAESTITGVPKELQLLFWGDRDDYMEQLLGLPDHADERVAVRDHFWLGREMFMELDEAREWLLDQISLIDAQREYYTKYINAGGVAVMGHERVDDAHFYNAREVILTMTAKRPELRERLTPDWMYGIAGDTTGPKHPTRFRMVLFEFEEGFPPAPEKPLGFKSAGGCGGWCSAGVSQFTGTLRDYGVLMHEFGHAIHYAINDFHIPGNPVHVDVNKLDTTFQALLEAAYAVAQANAVDDWKTSLSANQYWTGEYAMTNVKEYWAVGVAYWFEYLSLVYPKGDRYEGKRLYLDAFLKKDPLLYALLEKWFPLLTIEVTISNQ